MTLLLSNGTVLVLGNAPSEVGPLAGTIAFSAQIEFSPSVIDDVAVLVRVTPPSVPETIPRVVVLQAGGYGLDWFTDTWEQCAQDLLDAGFWVIEWKCTNAYGWFGKPNAESILDESAPGALLLEWLRDNPMPAPSGKSFAGYSWRMVGNSGGAALLAYGLTSWGLGEWADVVVLCGTAFVRLDWCCGSEVAEWTGIWPTLAPADVMTCSPQESMHPPAGQVCSVLAPVSAALQRAASVLRIGAVLSYSKALVWTLVGANDCTAAMLHALYFDQQITSEKRHRVVPVTAHDLPAWERGRMSIVKVLQNPQMEFPNGSW